MRRRLFEIVLVLLLAACQTPAPAPEPPPPAPAPVCPEPPPPAPEIDELKAVLGTAEELRKALALGRSSAELAQSAAQLDVIATSADPAAESLKPLAALMSARLAEQRRLQDSLDKLNQQLRDSQRRNDQLNETLEALKAIEQTLPAKR
jgi:ABC-type transporter Mla subunit MlaD